MAFNQFSTGFILGAVIAGLACALVARCPANERTKAARTISPEPSVWSGRQEKQA